MGQTAHPGRAPRVRMAAVLGASLLAGTLVTGCGSSLAAAATTLSGVVHATVVHPDGSTVAAVNGLRLHRGDVVRTAAAGRAELHTRGRVVYEASDAAVQVLDGARQDLRHGAVVVDAQDGPGLSLSVAGLQVAAPDGAAVRAERSVTGRIAALAGDVGIDSATGRHLQVPGLTQAVIGGDALPDSTAGSPLRLTDDDGEARSVPVLVRDDLSLNALAAGIDSAGASTAHVVTAAWHPTAGLEPLPPGLARSEQVLPVVIAAVVRKDADARYQQAVALRRAGASWGVVAHRLHTGSAAVLAALQSFQTGVATGQIGSVSAALDYLAGTAGGRTPNGRPGHSGHGTVGGSSGPSGSPRPSPSGSTDPVNQTIDKVLKLLPSPLPTATALVPVPVTSLPSLPVGNVLTPAPALLPTP